MTNKLKILVIKSWHQLKSKIKCQYMPSLSNVSNGYQYNYKLILVFTEHFKYR